MRTASILTTVSSALAVVTLLTACDKSPTGPRTGLSSGSGIGGYPESFSSAEYRVVFLGEASIRALTLSD